MTKPANNPEPKIPPIISYTGAAPRLTLKKQLRSTFIAGLLWMFPLFVSLLVLGWVYSLSTTFTQPAANWLVPLFMNRVTSASPSMIKNVTAVASPVFALVLMIVLVFLMGILGKFVIGRRVLESIEHFIENLPLVKGIYGTTKQVIGVFRQGSGGSGFQRVVLVEFPRADIWTIGFVTNTVSDIAADRQYVCVFIPMTPNPTSGFFQIVPVTQVRETDWTVDQGIKIILSGGLLAPSALSFGKPAAVPPV
jgi:uncharacterized membrane protein